MKAKPMLAMTALILSSGLVLAAGQPTDHEAHHPDSAADAAADAPAMSEGCMAMMKEMRSQMARIHETEDPVKRDELIQAHMASMREMMEKMQDMHGENSMMLQSMNMSGEKMMDDKTAGSHGGMMVGPQTGMMEKMAQHMDMMQMMMDQMMQNQDAREETQKLRDDQSGT